MAKKLTKSQKAWVTRKANLKAIENKPDRAWKVSENQLGKILRIKLPEDYVVTDGPAQISLSKALDNSLDRLEQRMADYIARVDRILA